MSFFDIAVFSLKFYLPSLFSVLFRVVALGTKGKKQTVFGLSVYTLYNLLVPSLLIWAIGYGAYTGIAFYVMMLGGLSVLIFSSDPPLKTLLLQLTQSVFVSAMSTVINLARQLIGFSYPVLLVVTLICSILLFMVSLRWFAGPMRFVRDNLHSGLLALVAIPFGVVLVVTLIATYPPQSFNTYPLYCSVVMLLVQGIFFLCIYSLYLNLRKIKELTKTGAEEQMLRISVNALQERAALLDTSAQQAAAREHDRRHFNRTLLQMLQSGGTQQAVSLLQETDRTPPAAVKTYCKNTVLNASVCYYANSMAQENIELLANLDVPQQPGGGFSPADNGGFEPAGKRAERLPATAKRAAPLYSV